MSVTEPPRSTEVLEASDAEVLVCDVRALTAPDAAAIDALARLQLEASRHGRTVRLIGVSSRLRELLELSGLVETLGAGLVLEPERKAE